MATAHALDVAPEKPWRRFVPRWLRSLIWLDDARHYDAFLSYSWTSDAALAPIVQSVIQRFLCPFYRFRARNVFRDLSALPAGSDLAGALYERLDRSTHLLVLASPAAAASRGMQLEAEYWLSRPRNGQVLMVVTDGKCDSWTEIRDRLLPPALRDAFSAEPLWITIAHRRAEIVADPTSQAVRGALVEDLKQVLLSLYPGATWEQLRGEERAQRRRAVLVFTIVAILLGVLAAAAVTSAWYAVQQQRLAVQQQRLAESGQFAAESQLLSYDPPRALALAIQAVQTAPTMEAQLALARVLEAPLVRLILSHDRSVTDIAFSPDDRTIATATSDGNVRVWDAQRGAVRATLRGPADLVTTIAFSPDNSRLAAGGPNGVTTIWDLASQQMVFTLYPPPVPDVDPDENKPAEVVNALFSPDGARIVTTYRHRIVGNSDLWDAVSGKHIAFLSACDEASVQAVFSRDSKLLATWGSRCAQASVWDGSTGLRLKTVGRFDPKDVTEQQGSGVARWVKQIVFAPDGQTVIVVMAGDMTSLWDPRTGRMRRVLGRQLAAEIDSAAFSPDGSRIVSSSSDYALTLWNAATLEAIHSRTGHSAEIRRVEFTRDGHRIVSVSADNSVRIWGAADATPIAVLGGGPSTLSKAVASANGLRIVTTDATTTELWDTERTHPLGTFGEGGAELDMAAVLPDGRTALTCTREEGCRRWDVSLPSAAGVVAPPRANIRSSRLSPDGRRLVVSGPEDDVEIRDPVSGQRLGGVAPLDCRRIPPLSRDLARMLCVDTTYQGASIIDLERGAEIAKISGHSSYIQAAEFSPDRTRVVTASSDTTARVWDVATGQTVASLQHPMPVEQAAFASDGVDVFTIDRGGAVRRWDVMNSRVRFEIGEKLEPGTAFHASPAGDRMLYVTNDARVRKAVLFDANTGRIVATFGPFNTYLVNPSFSPDGTRVLIGSWDRTARLWDARTGELQMTLRGHTDALRDVTFSPDGRQVATAGLDRTAKLWDVASGRLLASFEAGFQVDTVSFSADGGRLLVTGDFARLYPATRPELLRWAERLRPPVSAASAR
jgi:WD40 repeat protein